MLTGEPRWSLVCLNVAIMWATGFLVELLYFDDPSRRADSVFKCICRLAADPTNEMAHRALTQWKKSVAASSPRRFTVLGWSATPAHRVQVVRRILFYFLHIPFMLVASIPAGGYVSYPINDSSAFDVFDFLPLRSLHFEPLRL